jgi:hypothetical protein
MILSRNISLNGWLSDHTIQTSRLFVVHCIPVNLLSISYPQRTTCYHYGSRHFRGSSCCRADRNSLQLEQLGSCLHSIFRPQPGWRILSPSSTKANETTFFSLPQSPSSFLKGPKVFKRTNNQNSVGQLYFKLTCVGL